MSIFSYFRRTTGAVAALLVLGLLSAPLMITSAEARAGGGFNFGSRGTRTFSAPAPTPTAPRYAQPFQRTETPALGSTAAPGRFGFGGGLLAGLLGAGLMGSLFGGGFFYGIAAIVGLVFKLVLVGGLIWVVVRFVRGRMAGPVVAGGPRGGQSSGRAPLPGAAPAASRPSPIDVGPQDFAAFEAALVALQEAYAREDLDTLSSLATPEMVRHLAADLAANRQRGLRNDVSRTQLLQGDLSEAWREGPAEYATVAMRFAAVDVMVERAGGRLVSGDPSHPVEATELWTFQRRGGEGWRVSALQQGG